MASGIKTNDSGFTLLEVLLAIGITAIIGVSTYTLLNQTLRTRDHLSVQAERLRELQLMASIVQNDLRQISSRVVRDQFGDYQPAIRVGGYSLHGALEFSKDGVSNPLRVNKSNFQRIAYELSDDKLIRYVWPVLDRAPDTEPREQILLDGVVEIGVKVLSGEDWLTSWPKDDIEKKPQELKKLPKAISFEVTTESGRISRWIESIPGGE